MEFIIVGGAPLSRETHEFIRVCLGAIVVPVSELNFICQINVPNYNSSDLSRDLNHTSLFISRVTV